LRLDEQGLDISSPWEINGEDSIVGTLWPRLYKAWLDKEERAGCREVVDEVLLERDQAHLCLKACAGLLVGSSEPAILSLSQFRCSQTQRMCLDELASRPCRLTPLEHATLTSWLSMTSIQLTETSAKASGISVATADSGAQLSFLYRGSRDAGGDAEVNVDPIGLGRALPTRTCVDTAMLDHTRCPPCIR
jgi:hypothetical protein